MKRLLGTTFLVGLGLLVGTYSDALAQPVTDGEGDVAIGALEVAPTSILELVSTTKGFLLPRMTTTQRDAISSPAEALMIFNITTGEFNYWDANTSSWEVFITSPIIGNYAWKLNGNDLNASVYGPGAYNGVTGNFLGTTSADNAVVATTQNQAIEFWTNNNQRLLIDATGNFRPATDNTYTLGTDAIRWADAYVNGGSVHIGPAGGEAGNTEMNLGYAGGAGTINVDGGAVEVDVTTATTSVNNDLAVDGNTTLGDNAAADATTINGTLTQNGAGQQVTLNGNVDATNGLDVSGANLTVDAGVSIDAPGAGHDLGTAGTDAQVLLVEGDPMNVGNYELMVDGDVQITGFLSLPALTPGSVLYTDALGNLATDNPPFAYNDATNTVTTENIVVTATTDAQGTVVNTTGDVTVDDNLVVTGTSDLQGAVSNSTGDLTINDNTDITPTATGNQLEITNFDAASTAIKINANGGVGVDIDPASTGIIIDATTTGIDFQGSSPLTGIDIQATNVGVNITGAPVSIQATGDINTDANLNVDGATTLGDGTDMTTVNGPITQTGGTNQVSFAGNVDATNGLDVTNADLTVGGANFTVDDATGNTSILGTLYVDQAATLNNNLDVSGATHLLSTLDVDGATNLNSTLEVDGLVTINNSINQTGGGPVTFSGNVDANNGLDVSGADLTVDPTVAIDAPGSGHQFGTAGTDAQVVRIDGDPMNVGDYELIVDGDVQITGLLSLPGLGANAVVVTDAAGNIITDTELSYDATTNVLDVQGTVINSTGAVTLDDNATVTGNLNVDGNATLGNNAGVDVHTINGAATFNQTGGGAGITLNEADAGSGIQVNEGGVGDGVNIIESDIGSGLDITESGPGPGIVVNEADNGNGITINAAGAGLGLEVNGGAIDGNAAANELGAGTAARQLTVLGVADAVVGNTIAGNPTVWDEVIQGDLGVSGIIKSGGSLWIDGVSATHSITANQPMNVNTLGANNLTLSTNSTTAVTIDGATQVVTINDDLNVDGNTTLVGTLDAQGAVSNSTGDVVINDDANVTGSLDVDTDLNVDGSTTLVGTLDAQGAVSNSTGDVVINDDANVTGSLDVDTDLNVDGNTTLVGTLDAQGAVSNSTGDVVINDDANVTGSLDVDTDLNVDGNTTFSALSGGGNQALYVDNTGAVQASNATPAQNAAGIFTGSTTIAAPNAGGTEAIADANVTAGSIIVFSRVAPTGPQLSSFIVSQTAGVGFTIQFSGPVTAGDRINYTIVNP